MFTVTLYSVNLYILHWPKQLADDDDMRHLCNSIFLPASCARRV
jgi:hypothetical protein